MASKEKILKKLHQELQGRKLYTHIAELYGCTKQYVSNVLNGNAPYNQLLIDVCIDVLEKDKKNEAVVLQRTADRLGITG